MRREVRFALAAVVTLLLIAGIAAAVYERSLGPSFRILSCNMFPALHPGDRYHVDTAPNTIHRGDIVQYVPEPPERSGDDDLRVSRVVGMPGEEIEFRDGKLYVNARVHRESYLSGPPAFGPDASATRIPTGSYYVVGDNRDGSKDSRVFGPVSDIRAKATKIRHGHAGQNDPDCG